MHRRFGSILLLGMLIGAPARAVVLPPQFVVENAVPGVVFDLPTAVAFLPGGRMLVAEKRGRIWAVTNGVKHATPLWAREDEVLSDHDRGLLGLAVDPNYATNRSIYMLYTVDPDSDGVDTNAHGFGRLVRYQVSAIDSNVVSPASRTVLMGVDWGRGPVSAADSHTIGDLHFGSDGSLIVSAGDGAFYGEVDRGGLHPDAFGPGHTDPYEDIGAFRAQYIGSLAGKILRVNPVTGLGYASNPYYDGNLASVRSRVWAYGVRNPFRFTIRPNTGSTDPWAGNPGTLYIGDVGWNYWEEVDVVPARGGVNLGWPCYEGFDLGPYQYSTPAHNGCDSFGTGTNPSPASPPLASWHHSQASQSTPPGFKGNCSIGGVFYTGAFYPAEFRQQYFFADYGQNWMKVAVLNAGNQITAVLDFAADLEGPVDLALEPASKNIVYVSIGSGEVRRIRYTGSTSNAAPLAFATGTPNTGKAPLQVSFSSAGSYDPDGDAFTTSWNFRDGQGSTSPNPTHTYDVGTWQAILTLDDNRGGIGRDTVVVVAAASSSFPATNVLDSFNRANGPLGASWTDPVFGSGNLAVNNNTLVEWCCVYAAPIWNGGPFGPDQEAYVRFAAVTANAPEHDLMLKLESPRYDAPHVEVRYDAGSGNVFVAASNSAGGWMSGGAPLPANLAPGDQLGARAYSNGTVTVYKNGVELGSGNLSGWPGAGQGGWIGLALGGAYDSRLDDFGGGTVSVSGNTPPFATILAPTKGTCYVAGEPIAFHGRGTDVEQSSSSLNYRWVANLHHNNHVHPGSFVANGPDAVMTGENHEDGTGVWYEIELRVGDAGWLSDTARVEIYPEIDLVPSRVTSLPGIPGTAAPADYQFSILNRGRMPAPMSHWQLVADGATLAEGDTVVAAGGSVSVLRTLPPSLAAGDHVLRLKVDSLGAVHETIETNNATMRRLSVVEGDGAPGPPDDAALSPSLSDALPNPSRGAATFALELQRRSRVEWSVYDLLGRRIWSEAAGELDSGRWTLNWPGRFDDGRAAMSGLYFVRVDTGSRILTRRFALLR